MVWMPTEIILTNEDGKSNEDISSLSSRCPLCKIKQLRSRTPVSGEQRSRNLVACQELVPNSRLKMSVHQHSGELQLT